MGAAAGCEEPRRSATGGVCISTGLGDWCARRRHGPLDQGSNSCVVAPLRLYLDHDGDHATHHATESFRWNSMIIKNYAHVFLDQDNGLSGADPLPTS